MSASSLLNPANRSKLAGGVLILLASGLPWWLIGYKSYTLTSAYTYLSIGGCMLGALLLSLFTRLPFKEILITAIAAHMIAFGIKVILDMLEDRTNHNLLPFEILYYAAIDLAGCSVLILTGTFIRKLVTGEHPVSER